MQLSLGTGLFEGQQETRHSLLNLGRSTAENGPHTQSGSAQMGSFIWGLSQLGEMICTNSEYNVTKVLWERS